jgi:DNA-binding response OmpR family regulator
MNERILVVDDEPQIGRLLTTSLGARGYTVAVASDGPAALDMAATWRPDLILLDLGLPTIDGLEVCRQVRAWSQVPIIVLTVRDAEPDKVAALDLGADDYLTKPFGTEELLARHVVHMRAFITDLAAKGALRPGLTQEMAADIMWVTTSSEVYLLCVRERGWTPGVFEHWLADSWKRMLLPQ